jgi:glycerophosphoryl diester phosphodiesterase
MTLTTELTATDDIAGPLIAHRGASLHEPENTLAALRRAKAMGCGWVEIDAQVTRDGAVVLMHDHSVKRTTDGVGPLAMMTLDDCQALRTLDPATGDASEHRVPLLSEAIATCQAEDLGLVLEFKANWGSDLEDAEAIAAVCEADWPSSNGRLIVTSFSALGIGHFGTVCPWAKTGLACLSPPPNPERLMTRLGVNGFHVNGPYVTAGNLRPSLVAGAEIAVATINDAADARRFLEMGAHGVITDRPDLLG